MALGKKPAKKVVKKVANVPKVPAALAPLGAAVAKVAPRVDGRYCYGLPGYTSDTKMSFKLVPVGDMELFEDNDIDPEENVGWVPFATFKNEPQFLAIQTAAPHGVGMWEHEDGKIYPVWHTLDDFASRVIDKKDKTPSELLAALVGKVSKLVDGDKYREALALIEPAIKALPDVSGGRPRRDREAGRAWNLYGLALKGVNRIAEARAAFDRAVAEGTSYAALNILGLLEDTEDPKGLIAYGLACRERHYFDDYARAWLSRYLAGAYLDTNEPDKAEAELRRIKSAYEITAPAKVTEAREGLLEYIAKKRPGAAHATAFLAWLTPKTYVVSPEVAKESRAWWHGLTEGMRAKLLEGIDKAGAEAGDEDIARSLDVSKLDLDEDEGTYDVLDPFLRLERLVRLAFYGDPDSIEPLRRLSRLESLTINNRVIKDFEWPSRANRDLWKAAAATDRAGILAALAAGAVVDSRAQHGKSALSLVGQSHDLALCKLLIERGADPWAGDHLDSDGVLSFFGDHEQIAELVAAAAKANIPHPEGDPWRQLSVKHERSAATFELASKVSLTLDDGESLAAKWPADVTFAMQPPKKDNKLHDMLRGTYRGALVSERLAAVMRPLAGVELLPVTLLDHDKKRLPARYFFLNPLAVDALVVEKCYADWNHIDRDSISELAAIVLDPSKLDGAKLFRPARLCGPPMIVAKEVAETLKEFTGVAISYAKR